MILSLTQLLSDAQDAQPLLARTLPANKRRYSVNYGRHLCLPMNQPVYKKTTTNPVFKIPPYRISNSSPELPAQSSTISLQIIKVPLILVDWKQSLGKMWRTVDTKTSLICKSWTRWTSKLGGCACHPSKTYKSIAWIGMRICNLRWPRSKGRIIKWPNKN